MSAEPATLSSVLRGRRGAFLAALLLAEFAAAMQGIAYSTVLPVIAADLDGFALFGATLAAGSVAAVLMLSFAAPILGCVRPSMVLLAATSLYVVGAAVAVFAPSMVWVLVGTTIRGIAAGLFGGFGMGAIGILYDEGERPRVFGLFALIWLVPSAVGPPLNALIAQWIDWRWAVGWPAVLVIIARMLMGATISAVPWEPKSGQRVSVAVGVIVAVLLAVGAWGSATPTALGSVALVAGTLAGGVAIVVFLVRGLPNAWPVLAAFALLCATYFGASGLVSLTIVEGLGSSVLIASVAVTGGLLAWSLVGMRPRPGARPDPAIVGPILLVAAIGGVIEGIALGGDFGIVLVIAAAVLAGAGMGAAYPLLSSEPFSVDVPATTAGSLIAFAETSATAWSALLAGGAYSALHVSGWNTAPALTVAYAALALLGLATVLLTLQRRPSCGVCRETSCASARQGLEELWAPAVGIGVADGEVGVEVPARPGHPMFLGRAAYGSGPRCSRRRVGCVEGAELAHVEGEAMLGGAGRSGVEVSRHPGPFLRRPPRRPHPGGTSRFPGGALVGEPERLVVVKGQHHVLVGRDLHTCQPAQSAHLGTSDDDEATGVDLAHRC